MMLGAGADDDDDVWKLADDEDVRSGRRLPQIYILYDIYIYIYIYISNSSKINK